VLIEEAPEDRASPDWRDFIKTTYGSLADIVLVWEPEGEYEPREPME
jgi:hypothetical protein